jgi:hypothetical protein
MFRYIERTVQKPKKMTYNLKCREYKIILRNTINHSIAMLKAIKTVGQWPLEKKIKKVMSRSRSVFLHAEPFTCQAVVARSSLSWTLYLTLKRNLMSQWAISSTTSTYILKDQKRRPEGGEWEPQNSCKKFGRCPKVTPKHKWVGETKIPKPTGDKST